MLCIDPLRAFSKKKIFFWSTPSSGHPLRYSNSKCPISHCFALSITHFLFRNGMLLVSRFQNGATLVYWKPGMVGTKKGHGYQQGVKWPPAGTHPSEHPIYKCCTILESWDQEHSISEEKMGYTGGKKMTYGAFTIRAP